MTTAFFVAGRSFRRRWWIKRRFREGIRAAEVGIGGSLVAALIRAVQSMDEWSQGMAKLKAILGDS